MSDTCCSPAKAVKPKTCRRNPAARNPTNGGMRSSWAMSPSASAAAIVMTMSAMPSSSIGAVRDGSVRHRV